MSPRGTSERPDESSATHRAVGRRDQLPRFLLTVDRTPSVRSSVQAHVDPAAAKSDRDARLRLGRIELRMHDARPADMRCNSPAAELRRAKTVAMLKLAGKDDRDDHHIAVAVHAETWPVPRHLHDHAERSKAHVVRIPIVAERERVTGVQPAMIEMAASG